MIEFLKRYWFGAALVAMLVVALPGFVLFGLFLGGQDGPANDWLQRQFHLTFHLLVPWWATLILFLIPFAVILLYFLKLKRRPLGVPSTFLWKKSIEDLHVNSLLQWLRQNVLLLLQLLALLACIYGAMGFRVHGSQGSGRHYIVMIDNSASMSARDVAPSRLDWAKAEAQKNINAYTDEDVGMVMTFNSTAEILQSFTTNRVLLRQAVQDIHPTQRLTRIDEALSLADSFANPIRASEDVATQPADVEPGKERTYVPPKGVPTTVHLFSDGRFSDLDEKALAGLNARMAGNENALGNLNVVYHCAGFTGADKVNNVAIVSFNAVRDDRSTVRCFARLMNFRSEPAKLRLQLDVTMNGKLKGVYEKSVDLPPRKVSETAKDHEPRDEPGDAGVTFDLGELDEHADVTVHGKIQGADDSFPLDDEAWLALDVPRLGRVLVIGPPNEILQKFYNTPEVKKIAQVTHLDPPDLAKPIYRTAARNGAYDLVIFDRCAPDSESDMPRANTLFIGRPPPPWKLENQEVIHNPVITGWKTDHPLLHDLRALYTVEVDLSFKMKNLPPRTPLLIEGRKIDVNRNMDTALLVALNRDPFTDLVLTFPILTDAGDWNTTWPLQSSFPLFLRSLLFWGCHINESATEESLAAGQIKTIRAPDPGTPLEVILPDGTRQRLTHSPRDPRPDFTFGATEHLGVYHYQQAGMPPQSFAVNLLDAEESNIEPKTSISFGGERVQSGKEEKPPRELWKWFALAALCLLMIEWYIYNRRVYI
jgi:hypothetical protein